MLQPKAILGGGNLPKVTETAAFLIPHTAPFCSVIYSLLSGKLLPMCHLSKQ